MSTKERKLRQEGILLLLCSLFLCGSFASLFAQENYSSWTFFRDIVLNTRSVSGAGVMNPVVGFPVLVRLTPADSLIFRSAQGNGRDIRFSKWDGTHFPYQIQRWDAINQVAELWVLVDTVRGSDSAQAAYPGGYIKMYWGNASAADSQSSTRVFDTANGFQAVWHLAEASGGSALDATINNFSGTVSGTAPASDPGGVTGLCRYFGGAGDFQVGGSAGGKLNFLDNSPYSISSWVEVDTVPTTNTTSNRSTLVAKYSSAGGTYTVQTVGGAVPCWELALYTGSTTNNNVWYDINEAGDTHAWHYLTYTSNSSGTIHKYLDGVPVDSMVTGSKAGGLWDTTEAVSIGSQCAGSTKMNFMKGRLDELVLANVTRSADWIRLSFQNEQASQRLVIAGPIQQTGFPAPSLLTPVNGAANQNVSLSLVWAPVADALSYRVQVALSPAFTATVFDQAGLTGSSQSLTGLANATTYYWRANATDTTTGAWSGVWSFVTVVTAPGAPALLSPKNGTLTAPLNVNFSWSTVGSAASYQVEVSTDAAFGSTVFSQPGLTSASASASGLVNAASYYWRANASDAGGVGPWSGVWTFSTVYGTPEIPTLSLPVNDAVIATPTVALAWTAAASALTYNIELSTDISFGSTVYSQNGLTGTSATIANLGPATYYWRVDGGNSGGTGYWSVIWEFTTSFTATLADRGSVASRTGFTAREGALEYTIGAGGPVKITISNLLGRVVFSFNRMQAIGSYSLTLRDYIRSSGLYVVNFNAAGVEKRAVVLLSR
jgi:hypothetical protein